MKHENTIQLLIGVYGLLVICLVVVLCSSGCTTYEVLRKKTAIGVDSTITDVTIDAQKAALLELGCDLDPDCKATVIKYRSYTAYKKAKER